MAVQLHQEDCLSILQELERSSIDLAYLDPPFFTQRVHKLRTRDRQREFSFKDIWKSHAEYMEFLAGRLEQVRRVLADTGSIFFHCDHSAAHIVRFILDNIFGEENFRSEIIWHYRRWSNAQKGLLPAHQTIYFYSKTSHFKFNTIYQDYSPATNVDQILQKRVRDNWGKSVYALDGEGIPVSNGVKKGVPLGDVWDIPYLNPKAQERTGYPTQKPVLLLERIIQLGTDKGDWVLDPFCGSGTALVAAQMLERNALGIDISSDAIAISRERLENPHRTESHLLVKGRSAYQTANTQALALLNGLDIVPVQRNSGIDAFLKEQIHERPVPIRVQRAHETVAEAAQKLYRAGKTKHAHVMFLVVVDTISDFDYTITIPENILVVTAPASTIMQKLNEYKAKTPRID